MSRALARIKLQEAQQALSCLRSTIEGAAEQLSGDRDMRVMAAGLCLFEASVEEMQAAVRSIVREIDARPQPSTERSHRTGRCALCGHENPCPYPEHADA